MKDDPLDFLDSTLQSDPLDFLDETKSPSKTRSLLSAFPKGLIKGAAKFSPLPNIGPIPHEAGLKAVEGILPTQEGTAEDILEFTGEMTPFAAQGPGGLLRKGAQALAGGLAKKGAKEVGLPEWAQDILGGAGMAVPEIAKGAVSKTLRPSSKQASVVDYLTSKGLTEKEITPIIQNKKWLSALSKGALKYEKKDPWLKGIKSKLGNVYDDIRETGRKSGYLEGKNFYNFEEEFYNKLDKVPRMYRKIIEKETEDLFKNPIDFTELHDFNKAVNAIVKDVEGGKAAIGILKEPIENAQKRLSPFLFKDLKSINNAYSRLENFTDKMTKKNWDSLVSLGQFGKPILGLLTLDPTIFAGGLVTAAKIGTARFALKQILTNPRLQNLHLKMWDAFLKNNIPQVLKIYGIISKELNKKSNPQE